jgi:hypothetical protein
MICPIQEGKMNEKLRKAVFAQAKLNRADWE